MRDDARYSWDTVVPTYIVQNKELNANDKLVYLSLNSRIDLDTGICCPSIKQISQDASISPISVKRSLAKLVDLGLIKRTEDEDEQGFPVTMYLICWRDPKWLTYPMS